MDLRNYICMLWVEISRRFDPLDLLLPLRPKMKGMDDGMKGIKSLGLAEEEEKEKSRRKKGREGKGLI